jgi:hypothetical protein
MGADQGPEGYQNTRELDDGNDSCIDPKFDRRTRKVPTESRYAFFGA